MNLKEYIAPFVVGYIFASTIFLLENMSLRHKNKQLTNTVENITNTFNNLVLLGQEELTKKEGEKSNGQI